MILHICFSKGIWLNMQCPFCSSRRIVFRNAAMLALCDLKPPVEIGPETMPISLGCAFFCSLACIRFRTRSATVVNSSNVFDFCKSDLSCLVRCWKLLFTHFLLSVAMICFNRTRLPTLFQITSAFVYVEVSI